MNLRPPAPKAGALTRLRHAPPIRPSESPEPGKKDPYTAGWRSERAAPPRERGFSVAPGPAIDAFRDKWELYPESFLQSSPRRKISLPHLEASQSPPRRRKKIRRAPEAPSDPAAEPLPQKEASFCLGASSHIIQGSGHKRAFLSPSVALFLPFFLPIYHVTEGLNHLSLLNGGWYRVRTCDLFRVREAFSH